MHQVYPTERIAVDAFIYNLRNKLLLSREQCEYHVFFRDDLTSVGGRGRR
ncbi:hypothetical protein BH18ACI4_BH18ACI4_14440 [soil metagenome]